MNNQNQPFKKTLHLTFNDINFCVRNRKGEKKILDDISGTFPGGKLIGILGPSGSGKSTLLNILSGWDRRNKIEGRIEVNGKERQLEEFKSISCYITQDCYLNELLTAEENLTYAADLKLGPSVSKPKKANMIEHVLRSFDLMESRKTTTSKLSGGQRKRLAICLELLSDPHIIFLDEPTTGLDSVSSLQCMKYLKNLTEQGNSVVCTMHQPSDNIFALFDMVYIITSGRCAYQGGKMELIKFLDDNEMTCDISFSPLDFIVEIANGDYGEKVLKMIIATSQNGNNLDYMPSILDKIHQDGDSVQMKSRSIFSKWKNYSLREDFYEFRTLMEREFTKLTRDRCLTYLRVIAVIFNSVMTGIICYGMGGNVKMLYFNYNMVLLQIANVATCCSTITAISFSVNQNVVKSEYQNGYYSIRNFFFTNVLLDIPIIFVATTVASTLLYWLSGQFMTIARILMFSIISFECGMVASALGFLIGSIFSLNKAIFIITSMHIPIFVFSGFGMSIRDVPNCFYFFTHLAYTRYSVRTLMGVVFGYDRPRVSCPEEVEYCHYRNTKKFLDEMGLEDYYFLYDAIALFIIYICIRLLSYFIIRYILKNAV